MQIRRATTADQPELERLLTQFYEYTQTNLPKFQADSRAYKDPAEAITRIVKTFITDAANLVYVADDGRQLQGYVCGQIKAKPERVLDREGYIQHWFVDQSLQEQGIGKQLLNALIHDFGAAHCTHLGVDTQLDNHQAVAVYEHLGFTKRLVTFIKPL